MNKIPLCDVAVDTWKTYENMSEDRCVNPDNPGNSGNDKAKFIIYCVAFFPQTK